MKIYTPDRKALFTLRVLITLLTVILTAILRFYIPVDVLVFIFASAFATIAIFAMFIYLPLFFSSLRYDSSETEITRHSGVFLNSHQTIQYSAVQYTTLITTPFSRKSGLNFIVLFMYGGQLPLMFLSYKDAQEIMRRTRSFMGTSGEGGINEK